MLSYCFQCLPVWCFVCNFSNYDSGPLQTTLSNIVNFWASFCPLSFLSIESCQHGFPYTCSLFGAAVWIPWLFKHSLWIGMKWVRRTLLLLPTSCVWPPGNHSPHPSAPLSLTQTGVPVVGTEKEVAGGHRPWGGWQPLPVEWWFWEPANHGWALFTWH